MSWVDYSPEKVEKDREMVIGYVRKIPVREQVRATYINILRDKPVRIEWTTKILKRSGLVIRYHADLM